jgi:predicted oxidoreductase
MSLTGSSNTPPRVPSVPLSPGGLELSRVAYGTWRMLDEPGRATPEEVRARLEACVDLGITTVDTAEIYGLYDVEELLGRALRPAPALRRALQIVTKCGIYVPCGRHPERRAAFYDATAARIVKSAEKSLRLLGVDVLDLFLVHRPDWLTAAHDTAEGLERLVRDGKIRFAGVSNYNVQQVELLHARMTRPLVTNQIEMSLFDMSALFDGTLDQCQRLGMRPMAWSPLGGGRLFDDKEPAAGRVRAAMAALRDKYDGAGDTELALAWVLAHPSEPVAVFGTNRLDRIPAAARAASIRLAREDWYLLWEAAQGRRIP